MIIQTNIYIYIFLIRSKKGFPFFFLFFWNYIIFQKSFWFMTFWQMISNPFWMFSIEISLKFNTKLMIFWKRKQATGCQRRSTSLKWRLESGRPSSMSCRGWWDPTVCRMSWRCSTMSCRCWDGFFFQFWIIYKLIKLDFYQKIWQNKNFFWNFWLENRLWAIRGKIQHTISKFLPKNDSLDSTCVSGVGKVSIALR